MATSKEVRVLWIIKKSLDDDLKLVKKLRNELRRYYQARMGILLNDEHNIEELLEEVLKALGDLA